MPGNDDDPTVYASGPFDGGPRLEAMGPNTGRTCAHDLDVSDEEIPQDLPPRPAPPAPSTPGPDLAQGLPLDN